MKFNTKTFGVLLAIAALSFTACAGKTEVRTIEVPATQEEAEDTAPEATEPEVTAPAFTLPIVKETAPEVTEAPTTLPPVFEADTYNDWILDNVEYSVWFSMLSDDGYGYLAVDQGTIQDLGVTLCTVASQSANSDEYYGTLLDAITGIYTTDEAAEVSSVTAVMCGAEMDRLNG